jgi:Protein of unknown function (DUF4043)
MATTLTPTDLQEVQYRREYFREYVRESGFKPYMGAGSEGAMSVIHTAFELTKGGKSLVIPLVGRLASAGVEGNTRLSGAEESLGKHSHTVTVQYSRNAVELSKQDEHYDASAARDAVRPLLKEWSTSRLRDRIIDAMGSVTFSGVANSTFWTPLDTGRNSQAGSTALNTWRAANTDRTLFGKLISNNATDFSTSILTIDNTDDKLSANMVGVAKRLAKTCDPHIRPIRSSAEDGREYYVMFCNSQAFRDLKADSTIIANNRDARSREGNGMDKNPLFQDGDLIHDGVICREIPEIPVWLPTSGSINVTANFLCGAQAVAVGWGQEPMFTMKKEDDYGFFTGVGIEELVGANKIMRKHGVAGTFVDHGMVTVFSAAVGDA